MDHKLEEKYYPLLDRIWNHMGLTQLSPRWQYWEAHYKKLSQLIRNQTRNKQ